MTSHKEVKLICSCRHMRCCEETEHGAGRCSRPVEAQVWKYGRGYFCSACPEYQWGGRKMFGGLVMRTRKISHTLLLAIQILKSSACKRPFSTLHS